jgi:hypothetical protein
VRTLTVRWRDGATDTDPSGSASGFNDIADTVDLPSGSPITYTVMADYYRGEPGVTNTATLTPPSDVALTPNSILTATDSDAITCTEQRLAVTVALGTVPHRATASLEPSPARRFPSAGRGSDGPTQPPGGLGRRLVG